NRPPVVVQAPGVSAPLIGASLTGQASGQPMFVASYDPVRKALVVTSLVPPGADPRHVHQLWVIPADGRPRAPGFIAPGASKAMALPPDLQAYFAQGSAIAVSVEPPGGSTKADGPSGPIAAMGKLAII